MSPPPAIELRNINKSFGAVQANRNVDLIVQAGTIHGIVGENGAGKSTLMSILYGFYEADEGSIQINGKPARINSSQAAIAAGIGMVHQHFMLVANFSVLENVMMGAEKGFLLKNSIGQARRKLRELSENYSLHVDPDALTDDLPVGQQQRVEILKALFRSAGILILDEPTGVLTPQETEQLFKILSSLRDEGVTIILITHKLREIMAITDNVSVMRDGEMVAHCQTAETSTAELAELMVGRKVSAATRSREQFLGDIRLKVENLSVAGSLGNKLLDDINLEVRSGEIVGIAGVSGNGQSELLEVLSGIRPLSQGQITINGQQFKAEDSYNAADMRELKVAHVPEDRHRTGMVTAMSAWESLILGYHHDSRYNKGILFDQAAIHEEAERLIKEFDVRPGDPEIKSANMSGGNQQKLILAREIDKSPEVLIVGQPTRGVDIGAIEFIHGQLNQLRQRGCAILMVSVELDEVLALSDRILVIFDGRIVAEVNGNEADTMTLGLMMANAHEPRSSQNLKGDA
ncbi:MAG: ABC transporter ATP-binding protein [Gammaproteobacteria bacterium]|nr:ABC transporter ATP-binding protein [Gammaproteobacteria bacterium]